MSQLLGNPAFPRLECQSMRIYYTPEKVSRLTVVHVRHVLGGQEAGDSRQHTILGTCPKSGCQLLLQRIDLLEEVKVNLVVPFPGYLYPLGMVGQPGIAVELGQVAGPHQCGLDVDFLVEPILSSHYPSQGIKVSTLEAMPLLE